MKIFSVNDWEPLSEVIVGRADFAYIPPPDPSIRNFMYANLTYREISKYAGSYSDRVIDEANQDLEDLSDKLKKLGVKVYRPKKIRHDAPIVTPYWRTTGWHNYCPRDIFLVIGTSIVEVPSVMRSRIFESWSYEHILHEAFNDGAKWFSAPKQKYKEESFNFDDLSKPTLMNEEILFDAPNVVRLGMNLLYQVSNSGNEKGAKWLQSMFPEYKVHVERDAYSGAHFDSTVVPLADGLVLFNGHRVSSDNYPKIFEKWDKIFFTDFSDSQSDSSGISSNAIGMNLLSVTNDLVIVDENQTELIKTLLRYDIESIPMSMRHQRTLGGGFHCVTLDLKRG
tara:strand:- start:25127 stop:26140 length:1014 start_codon:yes stop_codon:yes gene_type:complete